MPDGPRLLADRYRLDAVLGSGGMGQVWRGRDETLGRDVAVKEVRLPRELTDEQRDALCQRMLREARMTARLSHPGVITVYDVVSEDDRPFIVMEMLPVPNLAEEIAESGPLPPHRVAAIGVELLAALHAAHADGIIHRDVKPSNVMLADGRVVLSDFGVAISESDPRMTTTGMIVGSPTYMSPERLRGTPSGPEADLWSLGATLYAAVEGRPPFSADTTMGTVSAVLTDELPPPSVEG
nr:serine/threonine protein kinase [Nocardioidaceae bacterium]